MLFLFLGRCWFVSTNQSFPRNLQIQNQANSILKPNLILLFFQFSACTITSNCMRLQFVTDRHKLIRQTNKLRVTISEMSSAEWSWNAPKMNVCQVTSFITEAHKKKYISQKPPWRREKKLSDTMSMSMTLMWQSSIFCPHSLPPVKSVRAFLYDFNLKYHKSNMFSRC